MTQATVSQFLPNQRRNGLDQGAERNTEQDRSHFGHEVGYFGERGRFADETRSKSSTRQADMNDGLHIS